MATQAQRDWAAAGRAAAAAQPEQYESVRIKSSVDRAKEKTKTAMESAASVGREYRGPTPAQVAAGTLEVGTPTTAHREAARVAALQIIPKEPMSVPSIIPDTRGQLTIPSLPPVHKVEPTVPKYPLLEGLEKYAVAPPVEVRRRPPVTTSIVPLYEPIQEIKRRIITGYELGIGEPVDIKKMKPPTDIVPFKEYVTAPVYEKTAELTKRYKEWMEKQGIVEVPTGVLGEVIEPLRQFGTGIVRAPALLAETAGMIPLGVEFIAREPKVAIGIAPVGIGIMAGGLATGIRERPFETTGELTGMLLGPKVITKIIKPPKIPEIPYTITRKTILPEGVLLKGKIGVVPDVVEPLPTSLVKYKPPKVETFIGKIKDDVAELYVKVPETELDILSRITSEKAPRTILTKEGKFMVIEEPRYLEPAPPTLKLLAGEPKITLREKFIGVIPYEIIKKVDIEPVRLQTTILPERMMLPEFTTTIDVTPTYKPVMWGKYLEGTKGWLEVGKTRAPIDVTQRLIRKDIVEVPYARDISVGIGEESALLGRVLSKTERAMVRDVITKERIDFEPFKTVFPPKPTTVFDSVGSVSVGMGEQQIVKPKMAPVKLKEKISIPTIDLSKDLLMPQRIAEIVPKTKMAPVALKEKVEIPTIDLEALFKRPTYEQVMLKRRVVTKKPAQIEKFKMAAFGLQKPVTKIEVIGAVVQKPIPSEKEDMVKKIVSPSIPIPKRRVKVITQFEMLPTVETLTEPILYKPPPTTKVTFAEPPIKPILPIKLRKKDKKDMKREPTIPKGFQYFIENPISSPFGTSSVGRIKQKLINI
jgi:hypothetical protein